MIKPVKYEDLYERLKTKLTGLNPGENFLSVRDIMSHHDVSQATVTKALEPLLAEKLLEKRRGVGMYVTDEVLKYRQTAPPVIALAMPLWPARAFQMVENEFIRFSQEGIYLDEIIHFDWRENVICKLPPKKIDGLIVIPASDNISAEHIQAMDKLNVPYVIFGQQVKKLPVSSVYADGAYAGVLAADYLIKLGHKKLMLMITEPRVEVIADRIEGFKNCCRSQGVAVTEVDCNVKNGENPIVQAYSTAKKLLAAGMPDFTGIYVLSEEPCLGLYKALYEQGIRIPEDISIIGTDNIANSEYYYPGLTTVENSQEEMLQAAVAIVKNKIAEPDRPVMKKRIESRLIIRHSAMKCTR